MDEMTVVICVCLLLFQVVVLAIMYSHLSGKVDAIKESHYRLTEEFYTLVGRVCALEPEEEDAEAKPFDPETATDEELIREAAKKFHGLQ